MDREITKIEPLLQASLLIVDDEAVNVRLLERILQRAGYTRVRSTTDSRQVAQMCREEAPDLLLLDLMMPQLDGFAVMRDLESLWPNDAFHPVLVLTADISLDAKNRALSMGAKDFLTKPFDTTEVLLRIHNLLETGYLYQQSQEHARTLEARVKERTHDLEAAQIEILERLARAAECRDDDTGQHTMRVGDLSALIAREMGLPEAEADDLKYAAPLHDVGKIGVSDAILLKPGKLSEQEFAAMKEHTTIGVHLLSGGHSRVVQMAELIALSHHEKWNGSGYPRGLAGEAIPLEGRIVALADVYDALTHERPYKAAWSDEDARQEIVAQSGKHFDPQVVGAFLSVSAHLGNVGTSIAL